MSICRQKEDALTRYVIDNVSLHLEVFKIHIETMQ